MKKIQNLLKNIVNFTQKKFKALVSFIHQNLPKPRKIHLESGEVVQPPRSSSLYIAVILFIIISYFIQITGFDIVVLIRNFTNIFEFINRVFRPDFSYYDVVIPKILETIRMAILGTFVGSFMSLPVAFLISSNLHKNNPFSKVFINIAKALLSLLRTFPILVYAQIILLLFVAGSGPLTGTIAIALFTFSILTKMLFEHIETLDLGAFDAIEGTGVTKTKAFTTAIVPEILPVYYSYALYCFDINVRHSAILGYVGAGGIGVILRATLQSDQYEKSGMILLGIFAAVLLIEAASKSIRKRLA